MRPIVLLLVSGLLLSGSLEAAPRRRSGVRAHLFKLLRTDGTSQVLASRNSLTMLKPASTIKLFTGWWAFQKGFRTQAYLAQMLSYSVNSMAQNTLAAGGGRGNLMSFYRSRGLPLNASNFAMADGSGLSYSNKSNCDIQVKLLEMIHADESYDTFKHLLAQPGHKGTLKGRIRPIPGKVFAKTGTLRGTAALSGFVETTAGTIVFCSISDYVTSGMANERWRLDSMVVQNYKRVEREFGTGAEDAPGDGETVDPNALPDGPIPYNDLDDGGDDEGEVPVIEGEEVGDEGETSEETEAPVVPGFPIPAADVPVRPGLPAPLPPRNLLDILY